MVSALLHLIWGYVFARLTGLDLLPVLILSLVLDLDFVIGLINGRPHNHRFYFHNIFSVLTIILLSSLFVPPIAIMAISIHFFLDFIDGEGLPLFYPASKRQYLLFRIGRQGILFPSKLIWEGNMYFSAFSLMVLLVVL